MESVVCVLGDRHGECLSVVGDGSGDCHLPVVGDDNDQEECHQLVVEYGLGQCECLLLVTERDDDGSDE